MIGILGGGQLGRMLSLAAARLGMRTHIFCPDPQSPAFEVTPHRTVAAYDDLAALAAFADSVDVITYEFENVPAATAEFLAARNPLRPRANALAISQDRLAEKTFLASKNIPVARYRAIETLSDLEAAMNELGLPAVLKTTRLGYDGKGQRVLRDRSGAPAAFAALDPKPLVLEAFVPFDKEISVVVARNARGEVRSFDSAENVHTNQILHTSTVPARHCVWGRKARRHAGQGHCRRARLCRCARRRVLRRARPGVPQPDRQRDRPPRPQFRTLDRGCLPHRPVRTAHSRRPRLAAVPGDMDGSTQPHLYGKTQARPGRKMGHINRITSRS